jgi:hypothetical protein
MRSIDEKSNTFYVPAAAGNRANVGVVDPQDGRSRYVRTYADGVWNDNLLSLSSCPVAVALLLFCQWGSGRMEAVSGRRQRCIKCATCARRMARRLCRQRLRPREALRGRACYRGAGRFV